jgi:hypothetical protein
MHRPVPDDARIALVTGRMSGPPWPIVPASCSTAAGSSGTPCSRLATSREPPPHPGRLVRGDVDADLLSAVHRASAAASLLAARVEAAAMPGVPVRDRRHAAAPLVVRPNGKARPNRQGPKSRCSVLSGKLQLFKK